ncbi:glycosyltransferase family 4 protein [bacterium]|nr:glycosyltransferase family 4 protein [bacterium]
MTPGLTPGLGANGGTRVPEGLVRVAMIGQKGYPPVHGGIERHVAELAARLPAHGFAVDIYSRPHYSALDGDSGLPGVAVRRVGSIPTKHLDAISHTLACTLDALRRPAPIVHYHALGPGLLAGVARRLGRRRTVVTVHGLDWQRAKWGPVARAVLRLGEVASAALPDRTIVVSRALAEHYRTAHGRAARYIPNGIDIPPEPTAERRAAARERRLRLGIGGPYALFVARLVPEKGCHLLLEAWRLLPDALRASHQLVVAGGAGFTDGYAERLRRDAGTGSVFTGYVHGEDLAALYEGAAVMVLPSTLEGLSITLLEAMGHGRCCLVSDIPPNVEAGGGCVATFRSGETADLARELAALLGDPARRDELGNAARRHVRDAYDWDQVAAQTAALYRELLGGGRESI